MNQVQARSEIRARQPFKASALSGAPMRLGGASRQGYLNGQDRAAWREFVDYLKEGNEGYAVWSYETPIAWWAEGRGWYMPETKYSPTTSRHQTTVRRALSLDKESA